MLQLWPAWYKCFLKVNIDASFIFLRLLGNQGRCWTFYHHILLIVVKSIAIKKCIKKLWWALNNNYFVSFIIILSVLNKTKAWSKKMFTDHPCVMSNLRSCVPQEEWICRAKLLVLRTWCPLYMSRCILVLWTELSLAPKAAKWTSASAPGLASGERSCFMCSKTAPPHGQGSSFKNSIPLI